MLSAVRDFLLSLCPASFRRAHPPESPIRMLHAATWGGLAEFFLASVLLVLRLKSYFAIRAHQLAPQISGASEGFQSGVAMIVFFECLLYPLSLFLLYLCLEGLVRFVAGLTTREVLPNFATFLAFTATEIAARREEQRQNTALVPDLVETLPDGQVRITSARTRNNWNSSITIGLNGEWFEVERAEPGSPPRSFVYLLRPAAQGKILRGYEEYDTASAVTTRSDNETR
jgi:hypothetical protein